MNYENIKKARLVIRCTSSELDIKYLTIPRARDHLSTQQ